MPTVLDDSEIERFVHDGFLAVRGAFDGDLAARCVDQLWRQLPVDRDDRTTWTESIIRVPGSGHPDLLAAINTPRLTGVINDLLGGPDNWQRRTTGYGTFPVRFPSEADPGDAGWHIDGGFGEAPNYRVNFASRGRALLLLMLFSDVTQADAPTRIRIGSHRDVARGLVGTGPEGVTHHPATHAPSALEREVAPATGDAGDVFVCHPFLVHAAGWPHRGREPRFVGQPAISHPEGEGRGGFDYADLTNDSPVKRAVRLALEEVPGR